MFLIIFLRKKIKAFLFPLGFITKAKYTSALLPKEGCSKNIWFQRENLETARSFGLTSGTCEGDPLIACESLKGQGLLARILVSMV